jgi:predicted nucleotidyltransferase
VVSPSRQLPPWTAPILEVLGEVPGLKCAVVFGSVARGEARRDSDLDLAVSTTAPLDDNERFRLIERLAEVTGRPIDLIDLDEVGEPLLGEILKTGVRICGDTDTFARLVIKHLRELTDFMPYRRRMLEARRAKWTGT